jgi:non-heme chloroperoxidase
MPYIEVEKGVNVFIEDLDPGTGKTILFLHGWPVNRNMFEYQFTQLPRCGFRCIGMDLRGFGNSDRPWQGYCYDRMAEDVHCVIESLGVEDLTLVGFSMGGAIAARYMARYSGYKVSKLALVSAAIPVFTKRPNYPFGLPKEEVNKLIYQTYTDRPNMVAGFGRNFFASNVSPAFRRWFNGLGLDTSGHATAMTAIALRDEDLRQDLPQINVPTGIFHGELDQIVPFPSALQAHHLIKKSILFPFNHSGHGVFYDELEKFNYYFTQFLSDESLS